jgi:hypothetical protein
MLMLLIQIIGTIATAIIAIILLQKDWRTKNEATRKETALVTKVIYAVTFVSILNLAIAYFQSQSDISKLEKDKRQLQITNANLSFDVSKNTSVPSDHNISYKKEPDGRPMTMNEDLQNSSMAVSKVEPENHTTPNKKPGKRAVQVNQVKTIPVNKIRSLWDDSDEVPLFHFVGTGRRMLSGVLINKENKPIYNLPIKVVNYDEMRDCRCFTGNTNSATIGILNTQSTYFLKLPQFKRRAQSGKYLITLRFKNRVYYEEAMYIYTGHRRFSQALRVKQYDGSLLIHNTIIRGPGYQLKNVNWDRSFPLSLDEQSWKADIAAN